MKFSLIIFLLCSCVTAEEKISFSKKTIQVGIHRLKVELAETPEQIQRGLMFRTKRLKNSEGMLFVFKDERERTFWMKNTFIPLSIGYFDRNKKLVVIKKMQPVRSEMETPKYYPSDQKAMYALEVDQGWFKRNEVKIGSKLRF